METSVLFKANYESTAEVVVNQGGTSSGKTYSILQVLFLKLIQGNDRMICTVVGQDVPNLKSGALRDALDIYNNNPEIKQLCKSYNKTDRIFEFHNGSIMEFKAFDDAQDAKSGKRDYLFINEANGVPYTVYNELAMRTRLQIFIDYNPNSEFWVHENVIGQDNTQLIISDHRHNPFVSETLRAKIEGLKFVDEELWRVYARGMTGKVEGLIFRNWFLCDAIPDKAKHLGTGLDFGFTNDPTSVIEVYEQDGELWINELIYETGLTNSDIAKRLGRYDKSIIADSAEPKSIEELRRSGFKIEGAEKGKDSVNASIDILKAKRLNVTKNSVNLRKELMSYKWKTNKIDGKSTNEPIDAFNHAIDALRYVALNRLSKRVSAPKLTMSGYVR